MESLSDKTLIMLVAPSALGKSTVMNEVVNQNPDYSRVRSFTTRTPRPDDEPDQYFYVTSGELAAKRAAGEIVTEVTAPTTGDTYGTFTSSYMSKLCLLDTLSGSVDIYRNLGFNNTQTVALTAPYDQWRNQFKRRYRFASDEAIRRLDEAKLSIEWSLGDPTTKWLINDSTPRSAAQRLIHIDEFNDPKRGRRMAQNIVDHLLIGDMWQ